MPTTYNIEINGHFSSQSTVLASSTEEALNLAAQSLTTDNPDLHFDINNIEAYPQQTYTSLAQHYSRPQQPERQPYTSYRQSLGNYTPYRS